MSRFTVFGVLALASMFFMGCGKSDDGASAKPDVPVESKIIGGWKIDIEKSIERFKTSPKVKPEDHAKLPEQVKNRAERMQLEITDAELKFIMGSREHAMKYTVTATDTAAQTVKTLATLGEKEATVDYTMVDDSRMYFISSSSDDMDYYVWQRVEEVEAE